MASVKLTKNELKAQKDLLKMYQRYLPTLTLKKQQLQMEIYAIRAQANAVRSAREALEHGFDEWIAVFSEQEAFPQGAVWSFKGISPGRPPRGQALSPAALPRSETTCWPR